MVLSVYELHQLLKLMHETKPVLEDIKEVLDTRGYMVDNKVKSQKVNINQVSS